MGGGTYKLWNKVGSGTSKEVVGGILKSTEGFGFHVRGAKARPIRDRLS